MVARANLFRVAWAAVFLAGFAGCSDPVADAQRELEIVTNTGTPDQRCAAARKLAAAYLDRRDEQGYAQANTTAEIQCQNVRLEESIG